MTEDAKNPRVLRLLKCASHGDRVWKGHVMCDACGRVYQTQSTFRPRPAPRVCLCGKQLMEDPGGGVASANIPIGGGLADGPALNPPESSDFTARPICYLCYGIIDKHHGGRVPNWISKEKTS